MTWKRLVALTVLALGILAACRGPAGTPSPTPTPNPTPTALLSLPELKYRLIARYPDAFFCDPDFFPIAREGQEQKNALDQFPAIRADAAEFAAILARLGLPDRAEFSAEEKLSIYREHKKLSLAVQATAAEGTYRFTMRLGQGQGFRIEGTISATGAIRETRRDTSFNTCPICLAKGTLIATPGGPVPVEEPRQGMTVWTADASGLRVVAEVLEATATPVPPSFEMVRVSLDDGRSVTASPGHPTAEGRTLGDYRVGDSLDGGLVVAVERVPYGGSETYDLLPSGGTGLYWANGVLLKSTL